jgi:hypothetical protein
LQREEEANQAVNTKCFSFWKAGKHMTYRPAEEEAQNNYYAVGDEGTTCESYGMFHQIHTTGHHLQVAHLTFGHW